ncbi:MAG: DUF697 domain-containing protein [Candidatus Schekmanbacteria bacterium]|nr:DUF697 domain-containing protein [Candidatus Schekmanbacteria bacterium]
MGHMDTINRVMHGGYDNASDEERVAAVRDMIEVCSTAAAAVAIQPIPLVDIALISPIQIAMVQAVGRIHGHRLDRKAVLEMLSTFGASLVAQNAIMAASKLIPFLGWLISASVAYALTYAVGEVSDHYFRSGRGLAARDLKEHFDRVYKSKKAEQEARFKRSGDLKDRLEQLKAAHRDGILTDEELARKKEEILSKF